MSFFPPAIFEIKAVATEALASFAEVNAELTVMEEKALKAGGALGTMDKAAGLSKAALLGLGVAIVGISALSIKAAADVQESFGKLGQAMTNAGVNNAENRKTTNEMIDNYDKLGFKATATADAYSRLITATGDVTQSTKLMGMAADYARFKHVSLDEAAVTLARGTQGSVRAFKEMGITLDTTIPKNQAIAKAFDELNSKIGGQAVEYTKTFKGQLSILGAESESLAAKIGTVLMPVVTGMIEGFKSAFDFLSKHKEILIAFGVVLTAVIIPATVLYTQKLYEQAKAWLAANWEIVAIVAAVFAVASAFVWAWNKFDGFRHAVITGIEAIIDIIAFLIRAVGVVAEAFLQVVTGPMRLMLHALGFFVPAAKTAAQEIDKMPKAVGDFFDAAAAKVTSFKKTVESVKDTKITLPSLPKLGVTAGGVPTSGTTGIDGGLGAAGDALTAAQQAAKDKLKTLNEDVAKSYTEMTKVIADARDKQSQLLKDKNDRDLSAQATFTEDMFKIQRTFDDDKFKLDRDNNDKLFQLNRSYQDSIDAAVKTHDDAVLKATIDHNAALLAINKDYEQKALDITQSYADKKAAIIQKSRDLLINAFSSATGVNAADIFASLLPKDSALASGIFNQVKNGVTTAVSWWGKAAPTGIDGVLKSLQEKLLGAKTLADNAAKLAAQGFSQTFIQQVVSQGPDVGNKFADAILNATPEASAQLKDLYSQIQAVSETGVTKLADQMSTGTSLATSALTQEYAQAGKDMQAALAKNSVDLQTALDAENASFAKSIADADKTLADARVASKKTLDEGLADAKKSYDDALFDMNTRLSESTRDAKKTLQDALLASAKTFDDSVAQLQKDTMARLADLQTALAATAAQIAAVAGKAAGVTVMANSPAAGYLAGTSSLLPPSNSGLTNANGSDKAGGIVINQTVNTTATDPSAVTNSTLAAINLGMPSLMSGTSVRGN